MRFRVRDLKKNRWVNDKVYINKSGELCMIKGVRKKETLLPSYRYDINLCTGSTDKHNILIYEQDILKHGDLIGVVAYHRDMMQFIYLDYVNQVFYPLTVDVLKKMERIGHCYDNADMLPELKSDDDKTYSFANNTL